MILEKHLKLLMYLQNWKHPIVEKRGERSKHRDNINQLA
ncbi:hypothetical protein RintRC_3506 [Richelia intracellularis]|nr:hypothetical protein RintRC_3506 [Richelia intracellularis]